MSDMKYVSEIQEVISSGKILNVLVVDDTKLIRASIREILELATIQVTEASDGFEALEIVKHSLPDLVLLDVVMPGIDGITVLKKLRQQYSKFQLPIVLVTSRGSSNEIVLALDYGANDYVTKPIDFDVLWARLSNQLMQKQAAEFLRSAQVNLEKIIRERTEELNSSNIQLKKEIEERLLAQDQLQKQANFDSLTGLPNRSLAADRLNQTIIKAKRHKLQPCLAFLDLDNFKFVNDTFGHAAGDELLREVARRIAACARESDTVARLGGDEFLLILEDDPNQDEQVREPDIQHIGERIINSFSKPFLIEGQELNVTTSIGFAIYPRDGDNSNDLMRHADVAMYRSKNEGKNKYSFYSPEMAVKAKMRMDVELQLRHALERDEFSLVYQPIVDSSSCRIVKAEALLRWNSASLGMISPEYYIPVAEEIGLILPIGNWVIRAACKQVKEWRDNGWPDISVTVNVSARQFQPDSTLIATIEESLKEYKLPSDAIELELTEGILMEQTEYTIEMMRYIENMGIKLLIDDFGTGYASLSYLQRYNFESIKIDRSYIAKVIESNQDAKLVMAVIAMAKTLGVSVVSEGVENKEQLDFLMNVKCEYMQGYYFSKPVTPNDFQMLLAKMNSNTKQNAHIEAAAG